MSKVVFEYDDATGIVTDKNGAIVGTFIGAMPFDKKDLGDGCGDLVRLKDAGYTAQEVMQMKREGLIMSRNNGTMQYGY